MKNIVFKIIALLLITHCALLAQVKIGTGGDIESAGTHPAMISNNVKGADKSVADLTARDAIATALRTEGMSCYVVSTQKVYELIGGIANGNWVERTTGAVLSVNGAIGAVTVQEQLQNSVNIKTVNGVPILGTGDIAISPPTGVPAYNPGDGVSIVGSLVSSNDKSLQEIPVGVSLAYTDSATYTANANNFSVGSRTGTANVSVQWNTVGRGRRKWKYTGGTIASEQHIIKLPVEYQGDTTLQFVVRIDYTFSDGGTTGDSNLKVWEKTTGDVYVQNAENLISASSTRMTSTIIRKISATNIDRITNVITIYPNDTLTLYDIQVSVIKPTEKNKVYVASTGTDYTKDFENDLPEIPIGKQLAYTDSLSYSTDVNAFSAGSRSGASVATRWAPPGTRGKYFWDYNCIAGGTVTNDQHLVRLPADYQGDTTLLYVARIDYIYTDGGAVGGSSIQLWEGTVSNTYIQNATNVIAANSARKTATIIRTISSINTNKITAVINVANGDRLEIYNIQYSILKPSKINQVYTNQLGYIPDPRTIDTTVARVFIVDANGTIGVNGVNYNRLDSCVKNLPVASNGKWNKILLKKGSYWHRNIGSASDWTHTLPAFTWIEGEQRENTEIYADGSTTAEIETNEDVFILTAPYIFKNVTIRDTAVKYCFHPDYGGQLWGLAKNCHFISDGFAIGAGYRADQYSYFEDCIFTSTNPANNYTAFYMHGTASQTKPFLFSAKNCVATNQGLALLFEVYNSNQADDITFENCRSEALDAGIVFENVLSDSLLKFSVNIRNCNLNYFTQSGYKQDFIRDANMFLKYKNISGSTIAKGTPMRMALNSSSDLVAVVATDNVYDFVSYTASISNNNFGYAIRKGKSCKAKAANASYVKGDMLKINSSGLFEKTLITTEMVAIVLEAKTVSNDTILIYLK